MAERPRNVLICSCDDSMPLDAAAVAKVCRGAKVAEGHQLCRAELERFRKLAATGEPILVACTQEAPLFTEVAGETPISVVNIRETAGWSKNAEAAGPKMAALIAAAAEPAPDVALVPLSSEGVTLIYGKDEQAIEAAYLLKDHLDLTVLIKPPAEILPTRVTEFPVVRGTIRAAKGHLGAFELIVDDYAASNPSSRGAFSFGAARNGATSRCDIVIDLSGGPALFAAADLRDGYLRADPGDPAANLTALRSARAVRTATTATAPRRVTASEPASRVSPCRRTMATHARSTTVTRRPGCGTTPPLRGLLAPTGTSATGAKPAARAALARRGRRDPRDSPPHAGLALAGVGLPPARRRDAGAGPLPLGRAAPLPDLLHARPPAAVTHADGPRPSLSSPGPR